MRQAIVYKSGVEAGILSEKTSGFSFSYLPGYRGAPISLVLPVQPSTFESACLHPYFSNLLPEGTNRLIQCREHKLDPDDAFGLLLKFGADLLGDVEVHPWNDA